MNPHKDLIDSLVDDLAVKRPAPNLVLLSLAWFVISAIYVMLMTSLVEPIRPNALEQLQTEFRFLFETSLGVVAILVLSFTLFQSAVPGVLTRRRVWLAAGLLAAWLANYVIGLLSPALEPSMLGKRPHCYLETMILAVPPMLLALYALRRLFPLSPSRSAMTAGLTAGMLPALYMQLACMYEPGHILAFHIAPGMAMAVLGFLCIPLFRLASTGR